jgi:energy-coupling factor transport system substrate-specific component
VTAVTPGTRPVDPCSAAGPGVTAASGPPVRSVRSIRLHRRSVLALVLVSLVGLVAFGWPFLAHPGAALAEPDGGWLFVLLLPLLLVVVLSEIADGIMDARSIAVLGVLSAVAAVLRPLSGGVTGFQPMFVVVVLAGRVFGPGFGFTLGATSMLASALVTGGVGPWLPFQMLASAWLGLIAGLLPRASGRTEVGMLAVYAGLSSLAYGLLMNLWFWPFIGGSDADLSFLPGDAVADNASRLLTFTVVTSLGFDVPRAVGNAVLVLLLGAVLLRSLRRVARRAWFSEPGFAPARPTNAPTG